MLFRFYHFSFPQNEDLFHSALRALFRPRERRVFSQGLAERAAAQISGRFRSIHGERQIFGKREVRKTEDSIFKNRAEGGLR